MYNILVFGLKKKVAEIKNCFSSRPARILCASSLAEFYSTAFSRVFDLWIIDGRHPDAARLSLKESFSTGTLPFIFMIKTDETDSLPIIRLNPNITVISDDTSPQVWAETFYKLDGERQARNRERYLDGTIRVQPGIEALVSESRTVKQLISLIKDIAPTESTLLLHGETGTGKELFAVILHNESRRQSGPFMAVNCGALPDTLLESELFGYEKGAFTGATGRRIGKIEHAAGGTLFLDEIEAMSEAMQVRLLRVLQEKSLQRLGSNIEISTDFRLICATNADPEQLLSSNGLRSDLYYRIAVFPIRVPPLRERTEDIPLLVSHFVNRKKKDGRAYVRGINSKAMKILLNSPWYGNIRELQNVIERAVMLADKEMISAELIDIPTIPLKNLADQEDKSEDIAFIPGTTLKSYKHRETRSAERKYLVELLEYTGGRIGESAQLAGLTPRALYSKMKSHGLKKEDFKLSDISIPSNN